MQCRSGSLKALARSMAVRRVKPLWCTVDDERHRHCRTCLRSRPHLGHHAQRAGMEHIPPLTKHHNGFCLWDTKTTERKATRSPLGVDVVARVRASCHKQGLKLALYFSEGDWNWPGAVDGKSGQGGSNPQLKQAS
jgi:hypothetical protein